MVDDVISLAVGVGVVLGGWYAIRWLPDQLVERRVRRHPAASGPPIEELSARLRRLAAELQAVESGRVSAKAHHVRALRLAYDATLLEAWHAVCPCDPEPSVPLGHDSRTDVELTLTGAGLRW